MNRNRVFLGLVALALSGAALLYSFNVFLSGTSQPIEQSAKWVIERGFGKVLDAYYSDVGEYPSTEEGFQALFEPPVSKKERWDGPYTQMIPLDPWGNPYQYRSPGIHNLDSYDLWSLGPDGTPSEDDIGNW